MKMSIPDSIKEIIQNLKTQDNRCTSLPVFCVQRKRRDFGYTDGSSDNYIWMIDGEEASEEESLDFDEIDKDYYAELPKDVWKQYYIDRWEFVQACFTEKGAENYIQANGHNLGESRIYVDSGWRNKEWEEVRSFLLGLEEN